MPAPGPEWATAIFTGLLVLITGLAYRRGLIDGGRHRPIKATTHNSAIPLAGYYSDEGEVPPHLIRTVPISLINQSDRQQILHFVRERSRLRRPGSRQTAKILQQSITMAPYSSSTWVVAFECPPEWPHEELDPITRCFPGRYRMTLRIGTHAGKSATWRRPRRVDVQRF